MIASSGVSALNHVEIRVAQNLIEVYASDAGTTALRLIARVTNPNLSLTRGLIWLEDAHYNADKGELPSQREHTFAWDNGAFDGPKTYRDWSFDAPDRLTPAGATAVNLGDLSGPGQSTSWTIPNVQTSAAATGARALFNFYHYDAPSTITATVNGHPHVVAWP